MDSVRHTCPVCGFPDLAEAAYEDGIPSQEICPSCGFQFGFTDGLHGESFESWRRRWMDQGMPWAGSPLDTPPPDWDPAGQVRAVVQP